MTTTPPSGRASRRPGAGGWTLDSLLADLELQAAGRADEERDEEAAALAVASYAEVDLAARLHGALLAREPDAEIELRLVGGEQLRGRLVRVGADFVVVESPDPQRRTQWAVATAALTSVVGLPPRAMVSQARPIRSRLGLRSLMRELADQWAAVRLVLHDGSHLEGQASRVGADFVELADDRIIVLGAIAAVGLR